MRRLLIFFITLSAIILIWSATLLRPVSGDSEPQIFRVEPGQGVNEISRNLHAAGLLRSKLAFETALWALGEEGSIRAGTYEIAPNHSLVQIIETLTTGKFAHGGTVTLIEGWTLMEYRDYLAKQGFSVTDFDALTASASRWQERYSFLKGLPASRSLEGYLFPDTYAVDADRAVEPLIVKMLDTFERRVSPELREAIAKQQKTLDEVIILASIVEKEVARTDDRANVADIFLKRLNENIGLQSDATVNYITRSGRSRSTAEDLAIDSPYNTYKYRGLPPGPIGNPSLDAIKATIYPRSNPYYYFLTDTQGNVYYGKTFADHQRNREKYL